MRASVGRLQAFVKADLEFHHELATSVDNSVLLDLLQVVRSLLRVWVDRAVQDEGHAQTALEEHEAVYRALAARDERCRGIRDGDAHGDRVGTTRVDAGRLRAARVHRRRLTRRVSDASGL